MSSSWRWAETGTVLFEFCRVIRLLRTSVQFSLSFDVIPLGARDQISVGGGEGGVGSRCQVGD